MEWVEMPYGKRGAKNRIQHTIEYREATGLMRRRNGNMSTKPTKKKPSKKRNKRDKLSEKASWTFANGTTRGITDTANAYRTDLHLTEQEERVITLIGEYLYGLRLQDWQACKKHAGTGLADRKKVISKACGDRYAYAICQLNNQQYQLQKQNIAAEIKFLEKEQQILDEREKKSAEWLKNHPDKLTDDGKKPAKKDYNPLGYRDYNRRDRNKKRLEKIRDGWYDVTFGGKSNHRVLMRAIQRDGYEANSEKMACFKKSRYNIKAIGDSTHKFGNSIVRIDDTWHLSIRVPDALRYEFADIMGIELKEKEKPVLHIKEPVVFKYGADNIFCNITNDKAVTNDITFTEGKWIISTVVNSDSATNIINSEAAKNGGSVKAEDGGMSFITGENNPAVVARRAVRVTKAALKRDTVRSNFDGADCSHDARVVFAARGARFAGVDVNAGHIDIAVCDVYGNLIGKPRTVYFDSYRSDKQNKSSVLHALDVVRHFCERRHVECVFFEDLKGFLDSRSRTLNEGGHAFRRCVSSIPTGQIKDWAIRKLTGGSCHVEFVAAAYTSQCAKEFWLGSSAASSGGSSSCVSVFSGVHQAAALMIARRGLGLGLYRRFGCGPVASCVTSPVCCPDRCENPADGFGSGDARGGAAVSGSVVSSRKRRSHRSGAASDCELDSSGEGLFAHAVGRVARSHRPCR